jgi:dTDP-4-amino-4,6-dideoxygalactose transaminase
MQQEPIVSTPVPFVDLRPIHQSIKREILEDIASLLDGGVFLNSAENDKFESAFADYCGVAHCVGVSSGLDALRLALLAAGVEPGDEVIVPAHTFIATFEAVSQAGGVPVPADATWQDYNMDIDAASSAVTRRTRFFLPAHLYGQVVDVRALRAAAERQGLEILEDACQAHGAERDGIRAGTAGLAAAFSFYPAKNLGAIGDAGALVTNDAEIARRARALRQHGEEEKYRSSAPGYTARLDTLQATVLLRKLRFLDDWNAQRASAARYYSEALRGVGDLRLPPIPQGSQPVWHLYVIRTDDPSALAAHLADCGIESGRHYPEPPHLSQAYKSLGYGRGDFPVAEAICAQALSLPLFAGIAEHQLAATVEAVRAYFDGG